MNVIVFILLVLGAICFAGSAFGVVTSRINLLALGLFFWILVSLIAAAVQVL